MNKSQKQLKTALLNVMHGESTNEQHNKYNDLPVWEFNAKVKKENLMTLLRISDIPLKEIEVVVDVIVEKERKEEYDAETWGM